MNGRIIWPELMKSGSTWSFISMYTQIIPIVLTVVTESLIFGSRFYSPNVHVSKCKSSCFVLFINFSKLNYSLNNNWPDGGWVGGYMIQELKQHLRRHLLHLNAEIITCVFICHIHYFSVGLDQSH